jgi:hypothetical protein
MSSTATGATLSREPLGRDRVLRAAMAVAHAGGLAALTIREARLGDNLVSPPRSRVSAAGAGLNRRQASA